MMHADQTLSLKVIFAFMFLTISTCWNPWLIPDSGWKWWIAYRSKFSKTSPAISELALQGCNELQGFALFCQLHVGGVSHCCRLRLHGCWLSGNFKINFVAVNPQQFFSPTRCCGTTPSPSHITLRCQGRSWRWLFPGIFPCTGGSSSMSSNRSAPLIV